MLKTQMHRLQKNGFAAHVGPLILAFQSDTDSRIPSQSLPLPQVKRSVG